MSLRILTLVYIGGCLSLSQGQQLNFTQSPLCYTIRQNMQQRLSFLFKNSSDELILVALLDFQCDICTKQLNGLIKLADMSRKNGMAGTKFLIILPQNESQTDHLSWTTRLREHGIDVLQETSDNRIWHVLHGRVNDFYLFDRCRRLAFYIPYPQSLLHYHYTISTLYATYFYDKCGPCDYTGSTALPSHAHGQPAQPEPVGNPKCSCTNDTTFIVSPTQQSVGLFPSTTTATTTSTTIVPRTTLSTKPTPNISQDTADEKIRAKLTFEIDVNRDLLAGATSAYAAIVTEKEPDTKSEKQRNVTGKPFSSTKSPRSTRKPRRNRTRSGTTTTMQSRLRQHNNITTKKPSQYAPLDEAQPAKPGNESDEPVQPQENDEDIIDHSNGNMALTTIPTTVDWPDDGDFASTLRVDTVNGEPTQQPASVSFPAGSEVSPSATERIGQPKQLPPANMAVVATPTFSPSQRADMEKYKNLFDDSYCYYRQLQGKNDARCYKGVYLTAMCVPATCTNQTYDLCCFQKFQQARFQCCHNNQLNCDSPDSFSKCCYELFSLGPHDHCCPKEAADKYWGPKQLREYCVPHLSIDYSSMRINGTTRDNTVESVDLGAANNLKYQCPYHTHFPDCLPYYYSPEELKVSGITVEMPVDV